MRICWFNEHRLGLVRDGIVHDATDALTQLPRYSYPFPPGDLLIANLDRLRPHIEAAAERGERHAIEDVRLLAPVANPTKIIGVPVNYRKHVQEAEAAQEVFTNHYSGPIIEQGLFLKASTCLVGCSEGVSVRFPDRRTDHEVELGAVIGRKTANVEAADALACVAGYAIALDMVVRGPEDRSFRKSLDSYGVLGPYLVTSDEIENPGNLNLQLAVNGEVRQSSNTSQMLMGLRQQIAWASSFYTLYPGDIIMTGTCEGVGQVNPGDVMSCQIEHIGQMDVPVRSAAPSRH
jgi:2,4-diketo-3-deoxy-L-fuconate hydrolase